METQLVDEIDSIVYDCHDIDDGLRGGYLSVERLQEVALWQGAWREAVDASPRGTSDKLLIDRSLRILMDSLVGNLVDHSLEQLAAQRIASLDGLRACAVPLACVSPSMLAAKEAVEAFLFANLYRHHLVNRVFHKARRVLGDLFTFFTTYPDSLPPEHAARAEGAGLHRAVADYIAGMTDRFAMEEHQRLFSSLVR